jgi:hypothetical protein
MHHGIARCPQSIDIRPPQVAFISQEAKEKAREIQVKADEEFAIEKVSGLRLTRLV